MSIVFFVDHGSQHLGLVDVSLHLESNAVPKLSMGRMVLCECFQGVDSGRVAYLGG